MTGLTRGDGTEGEKKEKENEEKEEKEEEEEKKGEEKKFSHKGRDEMGRDQSRAVQEVLAALLSHLQNRMKDEIFSIKLLYTRTYNMDYLKYSESKPKAGLCCTPLCSINITTHLTYLL